MTTTDIAAEAGAGCGCSAGDDAVPGPAACLCGAAPAEPAGCGQGEESACGCAAPAAEAAPAARAAGPGVTDLGTPVVRRLRTSGYIIYVDLPRNTEEMLLVHGYTGAFDKVSTRVATYLRAMEDRGSPKPLYGAWAPDPEVMEVPELSDASIEILQRRGYLTNLTREEELERFRHVADSLHAQQTYPGYVLMPTYDCNLRCFYCFQDHMRTKPEFAYLLKRMSLPMVDRILEARILLRAHEGGTKGLSVVTNATDLDAYSDLLGPGQPEMLQITLDGVPAEHDKRRIYPDGRGSFEAIAANITMALDRKARINVRMNIDRNNVADLPVLARIFTDRGWADHPGFLAYTAPVHAGNEKTERATTFSSWELDQALDGLREQDPVMTVIRRPDDQLRSRALSIFLSGDHPGMQPTYCGAHKGMYVIDKFGDLYACRERTGNAKIRIGRIDENSAVEINEANTSMWRTRTVTANSVCSQCRYGLYCGGGCAVLAEGRKGRLDRNYCDGYGSRFRAMVAEAYQDFKDGQLDTSAVAAPFTM